MRDRLEDLGYIYAVLQDLLDHDIWDTPWHRPKDAAEVWSILSPDQQQDKIHDLAYNLQYIHEKLSALYLIAKGDIDDRL